MSSLGRAPGPQSSRTQSQKVLRMAFPTGLALLIWTAAAVGRPGPEERLHDAVRVTPRSPKAHLDLVEWHMTINDTDKALSALKYAVSVDSEHAWRYHQRSGDIHYDNRLDYVASEAAYQEALRGNPRARRSLLRYGSLRIWQGKREEADSLFEDAVKAGLLRNPQQRPLETFLDELPSDHGPWFPSNNYMLLDDAMETLAHPQVVEVFQKEYTSWLTESGAKDALVVSRESDPKAPGRHLQFWIHRPHFVDGIWRDMCAVETPKICQALKSLNESSGITIHSASLEVLENGALVRPHCHTTNGELFVDICLSAPEEKLPGSVASTTAGGEQRPWVTGDVSILDGSFEHVQANRALGARAVVLRLTIQHPDLPCVGGYEECGGRGLAGAWWTWAKRMMSDMYGVMYASVFGAADESAGEL